MCQGHLTKDPAECPYAKLQPDRWDEPGGWLCTISKNLEGCSGELGATGPCPIIHRVGAKCPRCYAEGEDAHLIHDEVMDIFGCDECCAMFWPRQVQDEWRTLNRRLDHEHYTRLVREVATQRKQKEAA